MGNLWGGHPLFHFAMTKGHSGPVHWLKAQHCRWVGHTHKVHEGKAMARSSHQAPMPMEPDSEGSDLDSHVHSDSSNGQPPELIAEGTRQFLILHEAETEIRKRTQWLTKGERDQLEKREDCSMARKGVLQNLEGRDTVRVLTDWAQDMQSSGRYGFVELECEPGGLLAPSTPLFPVLKVLLHAERAKSTRLQNCHCLNRTFFMPRGCECGTEHPVHSGYEFRPCPRCSWCMRCDGLPGLMGGVA